MNLKRTPTVNFIGMVPLFLLIGSTLQARGHHAVADASADVGPLAGLHLAKAVRSSDVPDEGPQGIYVDTQGHDDNDGIVGVVTYNNQEQSTIHIDSIYVHGENITTQGRFKIDQNIYPGEKKKLLEIVRDKKGLKSKVSVDVHFQ